jgi:hypothetical protein
MTFIDALEYYLLCFTCCLLNTDQRTNRSDRIYNEKTGQMSSNCIYSELLETYLNYFLPILKRDVSFPTLYNANSNENSNTSGTGNITGKREYIENTHNLLAQMSLSTHYPRLLKQSQNQNATQFLQSPTSTENTFKG